MAKIKSAQPSMCCAISTANTGTNSKRLAEMRLGTVQICAASDGASAPVSFCTPHSCFLPQWAYLSPLREEKSVSLPIAYVVALSNMVSDVPNKPVLATIAKNGEGEFTEKRSRFLCTLRRVTTMDAAQEVIAEVRQRDWDGRHHCTAVVLRSEERRVGKEGGSGWWREN